MSRSRCSDHAVLLIALFLGVAPCLVAQGTDECSDPMIPALSLGANPGSNVGATTSVGFAPPAACGATLNSDVWFTFTPAMTGPHQIDTNAPTGPGLLSDTVLLVYTSCAPPAIACDDDGGTGTLSQLTVSLTAGSIYYIQVGDFGASITQGAFTVNVTFVPPPPGNDTCAGAIPISEGVIVVGSTLAATTGPDPLGTCVTNGNDVWYAFVSSCTGPYTVTTCSTSVYYDEVVTVWDGTGGCGALVPVGCDDDGCGFLAGPSNVTFTATAGTVYYVSVSGYGAGSVFATGSFHLRVGPGTGYSLSFTDAGPGSLGYTIVGGPPLGGLAFTAISLSAGLYPNDWFFGIAITIPELFNQFSFGFPFSTLLGPCGDATVGPFFGLPSGLTVYGVSLGFPSGASFPTVVSAPDAHTIP